MTRLNERIKTVLQRIEQDSPRDIPWIRMTSRLNKLHDCVFAETSDAHCLGCGEDWPCESILIVANELKIEVN